MMETNISKSICDAAHKKVMQCSRSIMTKHVWKRETFWKWFIQRYQVVGQHNIEIKGDSLFRQHLLATNFTNWTEGRATFIPQTNRLYYIASFANKCGYAFILNLVCYSWVQIVLKATSDVLWEIMLLVFYRQMWVKCSNCRDLFKR